MKAKYAGMGLLAVALVALGYIIAQALEGQRAEARDEKVKPGRYQVVGAGLITVVMYDTKTGKTWALTPGTMLEGPRGFGGPEQEYAWAPITKFDDLESYRLWVKRQLENRMKRERGRFKDKDKIIEKDVYYKEKRIEEKKEEKKDKRFEDKKEDNKEGGFEDKKEEKKDRKKGHRE
jgi:hypothetical protein